MMPSIAFLLAAALVDAPLVAAPDCTAVAGFTQDGEVRSYETETLFDYMNGSSEGYFVYGFKRLTGVTCAQGVDRIVVDISEMGSAEDAWGMYMANRDGKQPSETLGAIGQVLPRRAVFVKGRFYVELQAAPEKDHSVALRAFVAALDKRIAGETGTPPQVAWFPGEGLEAESVRLVPESLLGIRALRRGYVGVYDAGKAFVVTEETPEAAVATLAKVKQRFTAAVATSLGDEAFTAKDNYLGELLVFRKGRHVAGLAGIPAGKDGLATARRLAANLP